MRFLVLALALFVTPIAAQPSDSHAVRDTAAVGLTISPSHRWTRGDSDGIGIEALPVRTVRGAAALLPRVRGDFQTSRLVAGATSGIANPRADWYPYVERAGQEPVFVVDGVRVADALAVPFGAVASVEVLAGFVPARYGESANGLILVETRDGAPHFGGEAEDVTSSGLDAYGYDRAAFSASGPLVSAERGRFFLAGAWRSLADASPYGIETYRLSDDGYAFLQAHPQLLRLTDGSGGEQFIPFPADLVPAEGIGLDELATLLGDDLPQGYRIASNAIVAAPEAYTAERFERGRGKDDPLRDLHLHAGAVLHATPSTELRLGGGLGRQRAANTAPPAERYASLLYARDRLYEAERDDARLWASLRQVLSPTTSLRLRADLQRWDLVRFPAGFSSDVADALLYGDIERAEIAQRYVVLRDGRFERLYTTDGGSRPERVGGTFFLPGRMVDRYQRRSGSALRIAGSAETQVGRHRVEVGAEAERQTRRALDLVGGSLARYYADGSPEIGEGVGSYDALPFDAVRFVTVTRYGYDYLGLDAVGGHDIDGYFDRANTNVAPHEPRYYAGYVRDRLTLDRLTLDLGLRAEVFDPNADALRDPFAVVPILRAADVPDALAEASDDWAVYFVGEQIVGYRDIDGTFYNENGAEVEADDVLRVGQVRLKEGAPRSEAFEAAPATVVWQPRMGVRLAAADGVEVFAYYARQARRPPPELFVPFTAYEEVTGQSLVGNARLRPEVLDAFGLGAALDFGIADLSAELFYDRYSDRIEQRVLFGGAPAYATYLNAGTQTTYGVALSAAVARREGFALRADYALSFAEGTGADAAMTGTVAWHGGFPTLVAPADFDVRHALGLVADYRLPDDVGPQVGGVSVLGGLGLGLAFTAESGRPYTALASPGSVFENFGINEARLPWLHRLALRLDKEVAIGGSTASVFLWIENVLGAENVLAVYRATGRAADDGYLSTEPGQFWLHNAPVPDGRAFNYAAYVGGPANAGGAQSAGGAYFYGRPRQVRLGVRLAI